MSKCRRYVGLDVHADTIAVAILERLFRYRGGAGWLRLPFFGFGGGLGSVRVRGLGLGGPTFMTSSIATSKCSAPRSISASNEREFARRQILQRCRSFPVHTTFPHIDF